MKQENTRQWIGVALWVLLLIIFDISLPAADKCSFPDGHAIEYFQKKYPTVKWDKASIKKADFNCDGVPDFALLGSKNDQVVVSVGFGPLKKNSNVFIHYLQIGKHSQDSLCRLPAQLSVEDQDFTPSEYIGAPLLGFQRSRFCKGINVSDGACDSFHYFWNHDLRSLQWWRL